MEKKRPQMVTNIKLLPSPQLFETIPLDSKARFENIMVHTIKIYDPTIAKNFKNFPTY